MSTRAVWKGTPALLLSWAVNVITASIFGWSALLFPERFTAAAYDRMSDSLGIAGWGALLAGYGLVLIGCALAPARVTRWAFVVGGGLYLALAIYFLSSAAADPLVSPWGPVVFWALACWQFIVSSPYRRAAARVPS